jgi:hypothetical protein
VYEPVAFIYFLGVFGPSFIFLLVRLLFLLVGRYALQGLTRPGVFNKQVDRGLAEGSLFLQAPVISDGRDAALYVLAAAPCASATFITAPLPIAPSLSASHRLFAPVWP